MVLSCQREHFQGLGYVESAGTYIVYIASFDGRLCQEINRFELYSIFFNGVWILVRPDLVFCLCHPCRQVLKFHFKMRMFPRQLHGNGANIPANIAYRRSRGEFAPRVLLVI
jgi:hypothetical protein